MRGRSGLGTFALLGLAFFGIAAIYQLNKSGGAGVANDATGVSNNVIKSVFTAG